MKIIILIIVAITMLLVMIPSVYAKLTDDKIEAGFDKNYELIMPDLYNIHNTIVCGKVIGKDLDKITLRPEVSSYMKGTSYSIHVEKYFKNSNLNATIDALGSEDSNGPNQMLPFEIGQIGLFYIDKIDGKIYLISPNSIKVKTCESIHLISPYKQFKSGIESDKVVCKEGLELIIEPNNTPACVKPESIQKLIERGWINSIEYYNRQCKNSPWNCSQEIPNDLINFDKLIDDSANQNGFSFDENQKRIIQMALSDEKVEKSFKSKEHLVFQVREAGVWLNNSKCPENGCALVGFSSVKSQDLGVTLSVILNPLTGEIFDITVSDEGLENEN